MHVDVQPQVWSVDVLDKRQQSLLLSLKAGGRWGQTMCETRKKKKGSFTVVKNCMRRHPEVSRNLRSLFLAFNLICVSGNSENGKGEKYNDLHSVEETRGSIGDLVEDLGHNNAPRPKSKSPIATCGSFHRYTWAQTTTGRGPGRWLSGDRACCLTMLFSPFQHPR